MCIKIKNQIFFSLIIILFLSFTSCSSQNNSISVIDNQEVSLNQADANHEYYPTDTWRTSTPEEQGVDSEKLYKLVKGIKENKTEIDSLIIVRNGYIITEANFSGDENSIRALNSCTKSITSTLVGVAINDGYIKNIDMKLLDIYPEMEIKNNNALKKQITLKHLLTMSAGFDWNEWSSSYDDLENPAIQLGRSFNTVQFMLDQSVSSESGKVFNYNSGETHLLSAIYTKLSGKTIAEYAEDKLFKPLGITKKYWEIAPDGITYGGFGLNMRAIDMAKVGYLFLKKGKWVNEQIIPEEWVENSTKKHIDADFYGTSNGYGYQWWINSFGGYSARGLHGQYIIVMPELNMVVVFQSHFTDNDLIPLYMMEINIMPAVKSPQPIPSNTKISEMLKSICSK